MRDYTTIHLDTTRIIDVMIRVFHRAGSGPQRCKPDYEIGIC